MKRVLIGSPIHQKPEILEHFLISLERLDKEECEIQYLFIDDNENKESSKLLHTFSLNNKNVAIHKNQFNDKYIRDNKTHYWNEKLIWKVANFKNMILQIAREYEYDYLFLIDSDLVLHPNTLIQLMSSEKDIISNVFWTKWQPNFSELPQVWGYDQYEQYYRHRGEVLTDEEVIKRHQEFITQLRKPGVYEVGGLGACTLISESAIKAGVNFNEIKNISFWGEDRHFCIRAQALGFNLYVDTTYPAYHIYRESDLMNVPNFEGDLSTDIYDEIREIVIKGLEAVGSFHYKNGYASDWKSYFTKEMQYRLIDIIEDETDENIKSRLNLKATVIKCDVFTEDNQVIADFILVNDGIQNSKHFIENVSGLVILVKNQASGWLIDQMLLKER
ncbi:glycosyltransferase family 2 protein [Priestia megaterium]|uniref:glycosyltransferase family 2 protein n=1 Tax=Priestia megaterium TaxID=1404 RepID=UPI0020417CD3|nr:glycosyltransferase family 2 protein [Priestia megaterium]MCM3194107.1 hypothetical protein [Priestia megaterium]